MAENFLILKEKGEANSILQEAWRDVAPLAEKGSPAENEAEILKETIEQKLFTLNELVKIKQPDLLFEFSENEFQPQKIVNIGRTLYFFNAYSKDVYKIDGEEIVKIDTDKEFDLFTSLDEKSILLFTKPDKVTFLSNNQLGQTISLKLPYPNFICNDLSSFSKNIYLLDSGEGEIIKYSTPLVINKDFPQRWLTPETERITDAKSIAIDGSIWILTPENNIDRYYLGEYQRSLDLNIFPFLKNIDRILINRNLPYLFLLEPEQNRIIILDNEAQIIKQFQSEKFDDLKDLAVSSQGTIYLLNGRKIYQIKF